VATVTIREPRPGDGPTLARMHRENAAYYVSRAPDLFRVPDEEGQDEFCDPKPEDNDGETTFAAVAEMAGEVAGYLEARIEPPLESARWQSNPDLGRPRLFINFVGTGDAFRRQGVATRLVEAAEEWGRARGAAVAVCDTWLGSALSMPFWEHGMGYTPKSMIFRKPLS
jgi:ribosomal protein S18 acetylase RimI-like enzyme